MGGLGQVVVGQVWGEQCVCFLFGFVVSLFVDFQWGQVVGVQLVEGVMLVVCFQGVGFDLVLGVGGFVVEGLYQVFCVMWRIFFRVVELLVI